MNPFNTIDPANPMNSNSIGEMKSMYQAFRNTNNPIGLFQQLAGRNPRLKPILDQLKNGANPQQLFNQVCQQRGINPQELMNMLKG